MIKALLEMVDTFINTEYKHHAVLYNGKIVIIDYVDKPREFKIGCMRVSDNLSTGDVGFIKTPKSEYFIISNSCRSAKKLTAFDLIIHFKSHGGN